MLVDACPERNQLDDLLPFQNQSQEPTINKRYARLEDLKGAILHVCKTLVNSSDDNSNSSNSDRIDRASCSLSAAQSRAFMGFGDSWRLDVMVQT
jgi:hypothetical protein